MHVNILSKLRLTFCWHPQKYKKWAIFDILMTITLGVNMITRQMTLIFHLLLELYPLIYFIFAFQNYTFTCQRWHYQGNYQSAKFQTFDCSREISPNSYFDRLLLLKVYKISAKKMQRSYVLLHWRVMQNLRKN